MMACASGCFCRGARVAGQPVSSVRDFAFLAGTNSRGVDLIVSLAVMQSRWPRRGRHAIRHGSLLQDASRLRHAQEIMPKGLYRTRVSESRALRVCAAGLLAQRHPVRIPERIPAVRLPVSPG